MADPNRAAVGNNSAWRLPALGALSSGMYQLPPFYPMAIQMLPLSGALNAPVTSYSGSEEASRTGSAISSPGGPTSEDSSPISSSSAVKRVRFVLQNQPMHKEEPFETPAMRLKARPKRPNLHAVQMEPTAEDDDDDEDYVAPRTSTNSSSRKNRERTRTHPLAAYSPSPNPNLLPTNAYPVLALSSWPLRTNLAEIAEDGERLLPESSRDESSSDAQMAGAPYFERSKSSGRIGSETLNSSVPSSDTDVRSSTHPTDVVRSDTLEEQPPSQRIVLSVAEFDEYMAHCDVGDFVDHLNHPDSVAIEGLEGWMSTMERKQLKIGDAEFSSEFSQEASRWDEAKWSEGTYLNCDLRYYDLGQIGKYDVVLIDPPWRLRGAQNVSDEKTMFNNSRFTLQYNTLSNEEIMDLEVGKISDRGFIFLWTINSQLQTAFECLNRWGYTYVDRITWVKKTNKDSVFIGQGYYLLHSTEICLIGAKKDVEGNYLEVVQKVSNDLIFSSTQKKSQKPEQLYQIIERMFPGSRRVELFARNHNIRRGWMSIGNQLGPHYNWSHDDITCDECGHTIPICHVRYKHRTIENRDLCKPCLSRLGENSGLYFELQNRLDEQTFHDYYECNGCGANPLWGIRFTCDQCPDFDLCESCHDGRVVPDELKNIHSSSQHSFTAIETPEVAGGLSVHRHRCLGCNTFPIVGCRFKCSDCSGNVSLCQKCFFAKKTPRNHIESHDVQMITEPLLPASLVRCDICKTKPISGARYKCQQCFNFEICGTCHDQQRPPPANFASHKPTHSYIRVFADPDLTTPKEHKGGDKGWGPADHDEIFD